MEITKTILPEDHKTIYNGVEVKWFIGDINHGRAEKLGLKPRWEGFPGAVTMIDDGPIWEAWGSCMGKAYQLFAWFDGVTRELIDPHPLQRVEGQDYYFDQEIYNKLTNGDKIPN